MATATLEKLRKTKSAKKSQGNPVPKRAAAKTSAPRAKALPRTKTVQMNVRIDEETKEAGDAAFARIGLTPSQAVRLLWGYAGRHANDPEACNQLIEMLNEEPSTEETTDPLASMAAARNAIDSFLETWGLGAGAPEDHTNLSEYLAMLREEETLSSLREQGYAL